MSKMRETHLNYKNYIKNISNHFVCVCRSLFEKKGIYIGQLLGLFVL